MERWRFLNFLASLYVFVCVLNCYAIAQPVEEQHRALRSAKTVRIVVDQSYGKAKGISLPFEDVARRVLEYAGLKTSGVDAKDYDVTLRIQAQGRAESFTYTPGGTLYSGASVSGVISLEIPGISACKKSFSGSISPPGTVNVNRYLFMLNLTPHSAVS